jgi:hypothetical protein
MEHILHTALYFNGLVVDTIFDTEKTNKNKH